MFTKIQKIMSAEEVMEKAPLPNELKRHKEQRDNELKAIIEGNDKRLILIIGPCSADNPDAVCDYCVRLSRLNEQVRERLFIIPRIYTNKPRSKGEGYKGMYHQPDPNMSTDINAGIMAIRKMHIKAISESGLTAADEMLYPDNTSYITDLLSYTTIGARSSENQQHRLVASGVDAPVGIKNPMNGSLPVLFNSLYASQISNEFNYNGYQVKTSGNPLAHAILRGSVNNNSAHISNYHYEDIIRCNKLYEESGLKNPSVIIDTNHSNSAKNPFEQPRIIYEVMQNRKVSSAFGKYLKGFLVESYIEDGAQDALRERVYGKSITDACLGWEKTEALILRLADMV